MPLAAFLPQNPAQSEPEGTSTRRTCLGFAHDRRVGLEANVNLLVAGLDLQLVRLLRGAMAAADAGASSGHGGTLTAAARFEPRRQIHPTPQFLPRPVLHPTPRFEARAVYHPAPRFQTQAAFNADAPIELLPKEPASAALLPPPWRIQPWQQPAPLRPVVKVHITRPDIVTKGSLLDFFI